MDDLVRWLGEQLDTDEAAALAWPDDQREWEVRGSRTVKYASGSGEQVTAISVGGDGLLGWERITVARDSSRELGAHIAAHDPARVLREIDAKRDLLRFAKGIHDHYETFTTGVASRLEKTLRLFALAYADRPGFREEWRP